MVGGVGRKGKYNTRVVFNMLFAVQNIQCCKIQDLQVSLKKSPQQERERSTIHQVLPLKLFSNDVTKMRGGLLTNDKDATLRCSFCCGGAAASSTSNGGNFLLDLQVFTMV